MKELFISEVTQLQYSLPSSHVLPPPFSAVELKMLIRRTELFIEWTALPHPLSGVSFVLLMGEEPLGLRY